MIETFLVALFTLLIALYLQARKAAREIRRNRESGTDADAADAIVLRPRG